MILYYRYLTCILALALGLGSAPATRAQPFPDTDRPDLPLWELGFGLAARQTAEYPGSADYANRVVAFPYIAYRGEFFEIGEGETLRLIPFQTDRFELALSFDANAAVERRSADLQGAQPDLDALVEFGPEFIWTAAETAPLFGSLRSGRIELALQTRGAFSASWPPDYEGYVVRPLLRYRQNGALKPGSRVELTVGPLFGSQGIQDYFYSVTPASGSPGYTASGGYMGTELTASIRYPLTRRVRLIGGVGVGLLHGAASRDSPLFRSDVALSGFAGITVSLFQSKRQAMRDR